MRNAYLPWLVAAIVALFLLLLLIFFQSVGYSVIIALSLELLALALLALMIRAYSLSRRRSSGQRVQQDLLSLFATRTGIGQRGRGIGPILNTITITVVTVMMAWLILLWTASTVQSALRPIATPVPTVAPSKHTPSPHKTATPQPSPTMKPTPQPTITPPPPPQ